MRTAPLLPFVMVLLAGCSVMDANGEQARLSAQAALSAAEQGGAALRLARAARDVHDYPAAINLYRSVITANPADTDTVVELGLTQLEAGQIAEGVATFQTVPTGSKSELKAQLGLARASLMQSQPATALAYADRAVAINAHSTAALVGRGVALDLLGRHAEAQTSYRGLLQIDPRDIPARSDLALSLAITGGFSEAIAIMPPIARAPTAPPRLRQTLALIYGLKGDIAMAHGICRIDLDDRTTDNNMIVFALVRAQ